jgi:hypothetical protein
LVKKRKPCLSMHPRKEGVQCWGTEDHPFDHWAMVPVEGTDQGTRITWQESAR